MTTPTDAHLLAAIKAAGHQNRWTPQEVRYVTKNGGGYLARSVHAHAMTLARVEEVLAWAPAALGNVAKDDRESYPDSETIECSGAPEFITWGDLRATVALLNSLKDTPA